MKAMWKRVLSVLLCAALALSICPMTGAATTGESDEKIVYGQAAPLPLFQRGILISFWTRTETAPILKSRRLICTYPNAG